MVAAVGSYLDAKRHKGECLLRIEDIDRDRARSDIIRDQIATLNAFGFVWDGEPVYQSDRQAIYHAAIERLKISGHVYPCACTRREYSDSFIAADGSRRYPGTCRKGMPKGKVARSLRLRVPATVVSFEDGLFGKISQNIGGEVGDFVLMRMASQATQIAYQLAVVVDDAEQGVTCVVRGVDLINSTPRQRYLARLLGYAAPSYLHLPVAVNAAGEKLSKQTLARAVSDFEPEEVLFDVLTFLGQNPPTGMRDGTLPELWAWGITHWARHKLPRERSILAAAQYTE